MELNCAILSCSDGQACGSVLSHCSRYVGSKEEPMSQLQSLMAELEQFGNMNDSITTERSCRMLNITQDTVDVLSVLERATVARRMHEIGTSNGYSTLCLAEAARVLDGAVTTIELSEYKFGLAMQNFARSGLASYITLI